MTIAAPIPFNDLGRGVESIRPDIDAAIKRVLDSGWFVMGPEHDALERELSEYLGGGVQTVLVGNGTDALQLALEALGVSAGDSVITAANAGGYTSTAARSIGAVPVYADVDATTMQLSLASVRELVARLDALPTALVITHLFGAVGEVEQITAFAREQGIAVVEDCAQSLGASRGGRRGGTFADAATTSFYPTKNLGALGDGGAVFTADPAIAGRLRQLRQYGWESKYTTTLAGGRNSRLDELQAAILRTKLARLDQWNDRRRDIHRRYTAAVGAGARMVSADGESFVGHLAVVEADDREAARQVFTDRGIRTDVHYPVPDHRQPIAAGYRGAALPATELAATRIFSVPLFPELTDDEISRVCEALSEL